MANLLTLLRLLLVVPVALAFADPDLMSPTLLAILLALAIASDYFDGILARAAGTDSARGQLFDHCTDFVFVNLSLVSLATIDLVHPLLPLLIAIAFTQYVLDSHYLHHQKKLRMSFLGRWNGIFYFVPLVVVALSRLESLARFQQGLWVFVTAISYLLIISTVASIVDRAITPYRKTQ